MQYYIYGKHSVEQALHNPNRIIHKIFIENPKNANDLKNLINQLSHLHHKNLVGIISAQKINQLLGFNGNHQGYALLTSPLLQPSLGDILATKNSTNDKSILVILDQANDSSNIGAILRSGAAFNVDAVIITKDNSPNENGSMAKAASGALETIPLLKVTNLHNTISALKKHDYWVVGFDGYAKESVSQLPNFNKVVIIFGSEHKGLRPLNKSLCDKLVKIPFNSNKIESLNLASSVAIALYSLNNA